MRADRSLYLTADRSRVVEESDLAQRFLLVGKGGEMSGADAEKYGIEVDDGRLVVKGTAPVENKQVDEPEEDKEAEPWENKAVIPPENKRRQKRKR